MFVTLLDGQKNRLRRRPEHPRRIYVEDNCAGVDLVLRQGAVGEVYNIGGGNETTNRDLTEPRRPLRGRGRDDRVRRGPPRSHHRRYSIDCAERPRPSGWARSLDEALAATVEWYREHRAWWEPLKG